MKATVCANVLDEGQETTQTDLKLQEIDQKGQEKDKKKFLKLLDKIHILVYPPLLSNVKCL